MLYAVAFRPRCFWHLLFYAVHSPGKEGNRGVIYPLPPAPPYTHVETITGPSGSTKSVRPLYPVGAFQPSTRAVTFNYPVDLEGVEPSSTNALDAFNGKTCF